MNALQLASEHTNGSVMITVGGELDLATRPDLCAYVHHILDIHSDTVIVDLAGITFIDASGLSALIILGRRARDLGTPLLLAGASPVVLRILKLTDLESSFLVIPHLRAIGDPQPAIARPDAPVQAGASRIGR